MTPQTDPKPATRQTRPQAPRAFLLGLALLAFVAFATSTNAAPDGKITICHATESDVVNPYVEITIAPQAVVSAHIDHQHDEDIIPVFTHAGVEYSQNLDAEGLALLANDCNAPGSSSSTTAPPSSTDPPGTTDPPTSTTDPPSSTDPPGTTDPPTSTDSSTTDDNSTEVPFFTSGTALVLGMGGALASTLVMLRRRL